MLLELLELEQLPLLYLDLDKVLQIGNKFGKIFLILLMMTMLLILPLMMEFKEVEDSLLQCCYVWHGIVQVWLFSVKAIFTKKFHENDFMKFFRENDFTKKWWDFFHKLKTMSSRHSLVRARSSRGICFLQKKRKEKNIKNCEGSIKLELSH